MSLGVGSEVLASGSSDMLRESLLEDDGMASIWSSAPPLDHSAFSAGTSKPMSFSSQGQKQMFPYETT